MISEVDSNDYSNAFVDLQPASEPKKLYELNRGSFFKLVDYPYFIRLNKIDGLYSHCTILEGSDKGSTTHVFAGELVNPWFKTHAVQTS